MAVTVQCGACSKKLQAPEQYAGKKAKCPSCGGVIVIPSAAPGASSAPPRPAAAPSAPSAPPIPAAAAPAPAAADTYGIASLLDQEPAKGPPAKKCPSCGATMREGAVLCVSCGYDTRKGQKIGAAIGPAPGLPGTAEDDDRVSPSSRPRSFLVGFILCVVGALLGAGIWFGIALLTGYEIGFVAWGVGVLAGLGMMIGYGGDNDLAGITAAFVACTGILAAKWMIYQFVLLVMFGNIVEGLEQLAAENSAPGGVAVPADGSTAHDVAVAESPDEGAEATEPVNPAGGVVEAETEEFGPALEEALGEIEPPGFFASCFNIIDGVFILIAFFTAYKFGSGKGGDD